MQKQTDSLLMSFTAENLSYPISKGHLGHCRWFYFLKSEITWVQWLKKKHYRRIWVYNTLPHSAWPVRHHLISPRPPGLTLCLLTPEKTITSLSWPSNNMCIIARIWQHQLVNGTTPLKSTYMTYWVEETESIRVVKIFTRILVTVSISNERTSCFG